MLMISDQVLNTPVGLQMHELRYITFVNIAHAHNLQGNIRISLKYLLKAV